MKCIFIILLGFCSLFFNNGSKAAEKINIKFEEIPRNEITMHQLAEKIDKNIESEGKVLNI